MTSRGRRSVLRTAMAFALAWLMVWGGVPVPALAEMAEGAAPGPAEPEGVAELVEDSSAGDGPGEGPGAADETEDEEGGPGGDVPESPEDEAEAHEEAIAEVLAGEDGDGSPAPDAEVPQDADPAASEEDPAVESAGEDEAAMQGAGGRVSIESASVADPRVVADSSMNAGQKVTWDCVWLGSYPQTVVTDATTISALDAATGWSPNGDLTYDGATYRRLNADGATYSGYQSDFTMSAAGWLYFKWEPVKWRVLETDGETALVVADLALDGQRYNTEYEFLTWATCDLRSWLNRTFWDQAFSAAQQRAVQTQDLANADNLSYGTTGGANTTDNVFLLSESDVWSTSSATRHGFANDRITYDESRLCKTSDYAHAMGAPRIGNSYFGNCRWWLRSPGSTSGDTVYVRDDGRVNRLGDRVNLVNNGVRPAIRVLLDSDWVSYAGTATSDGTANEIAAPYIAAPGDGNSRYDISRADVTLYGTPCGPTYDWLDNTLVAKATTAYEGDSTGPVAPVVDSVVLDGNELTLNEDYTAQFSDYDSPGRARLTITGLGNYHGVKEVAYGIAEADFLIGRDTNDFAHKNTQESARGEKFTKPGFLGVTDYGLGEEYFRDLVRYSKAGEMGKIKEEMAEEWNGDCYGLSVSMAKAHGGEMSIGDLCGYTMASYSEMPWPSEEPTLLNNIHYLHLSQYLTKSTNDVVSSAYGISPVAPSPLLTMAAARFAIENWLPLYELLEDKRAFATLEDTLRAIVANRRPMVLGYRWKKKSESSGHAVLLTGRVVERDDHYQVDYYDVNSADYGNPSVYEIQVGKDFKTFKIGDAADGPDEANYINIKLCDPSLVRQPFQEARLSTQSVHLGLKSLSAESDFAATTYVTFALGSPVLLADADDRALYWDGQGIWGDMEVLSADFVGEGASAQLRVEIPRADSVHVLAGGSSVDVSAFDDESYVSLEADSLEEATLTPGTGVVAQIDGGFKATTSTRAEVTEGEQGLVSLEGTATGSVEVTAGDETATISCDSDIEDAWSTAYVGVETAGNALGDIAAGGNTTVSAADGSEVRLSYPRAVPDSSMEAGQKVAWDCVWLGSYPQSVVTDASTIADLDAATGWSSSGDLIYGGTAYRRLKRTDATRSSTSLSCWDWGQASSAGYCYFKWEPIKWRVLETDETTALVVSDVALDDQTYNEELKDVTWATCTLRSWLNETFWSEALDTVQQQAVRTQALTNANNMSYGTAGGADTTDNVFLLSESDVWSTDDATRHGFVSAYDAFDEARHCRISDYAHAMGTPRSTSGPYPGNCSWWLRSLGNRANYAACGDIGGTVDLFGCLVIEDGNAVRPAMRIYLDSNQISYAGTVNSDGTVSENAASYTGTPGSGTTTGGDNVPDADPGPDPDPAPNPDPDLSPDPGTSGSGANSPGSNKPGSGGASGGSSTSPKPGASQTAKASLAGAAVSVASQTYTGRALTPAPKVTLGGKALRAGTDYTVAYANNVNAGTATVTVTGRGGYTGSKSRTFPIAKAANTMGAKGKTAKVKRSKLARKAQKLKASKVVKVTGRQGKLTYKVAKWGSKKAKKYLKVSKKTGKVTVKKGTPKGTYKVKVRVTAAGNANYKKGSKTVTVKVLVR